MSTNVPVPPTRRRLRRRWLLAAPVLALGLAWVGNLLTVAPQAETTSALGRPTFTPVIAFGHVDNDPKVLNLSPAVPGGRVTEVFVKEGDVVPAGSVLLRLDDTQVQRKVDEARAALDAARAALDNGRSLPEQHRIKLEQAQAAIDAATAQRDGAKLALENRKRLAQSNTIGAEAVPIAQQELQAAEQALRIKQDDLRQLRLVDPKAEIRVLETQVVRAQAVLDQAVAGLKEYSLVAPSAGTVLQLTVGVGDTIAGPPASAAIVFCPNGTRIVRADVEQAFASHVAAGQRVTVEDDTHAAGRWTGRVKWVADWYTNQRPVLQPDPNQYTDVRTMPCVIELDPNQPRLRINQRVRVTIEVPNT